MKKSLFIAIVVIVVLVLSGVVAMAQDSLGKKYTVKVIDDNVVELTCKGDTIEMSLENSGVFHNGDVIFIKDQSKSQSVKTDKVFTDIKGVQYPVWKSINGKLYYERTSAKSGNLYKVYINQL